MAVRYLITRGTHGSVTSPQGGEPYSLILKREFQSVVLPELVGDKAIFTSGAGWKLAVPRRDVIVQNDDGTNTFGV
jgi:hypothetical protein